MLSMQKVLRDKQWERINIIGGSETIGCSRSGLSTTIYAVVDDLGNSVGLPVSEEQASDLEGADVLLADIEAEAVIADKSYEAQVVEPLQARGSTVVLPVVLQSSRPT